MGRPKKIKPEPKDGYKHIRDVIFTPEEETERILIEAAIFLKKQTCLRAKEHGRNLLRVVDQLVEPRTAKLSGE